MKNPHTINWFEIPVTDLPRATKFYETMMDMKMELMEMEDMKMSIFPSDGHPEVMTVHGGLIQQKDMKPSTDGVMIYLNAGNDLTPYMERAKAAGANMLSDKFSIGEHGYCAILIDTEGNRIGLHSPN